MSRNLHNVGISNYDNITLTEEEQLEWHFCYDWDGLLIHRDDPEFDCCTCVGGNHVRNPTPTGHAMENNYPAWICSSCGLRYGRWREGHLATWHIGDTCGWCGVQKETTEPRDFGYPPLPNKVNKAS